MSVYLESKDEVRLAMAWLF